MHREMTSEWRLLWLVVCAGWSALPFAQAADAGGEPAGPTQVLQQLIDSEFNGTVDARQDLALFSARLTDSEAGDMAYTVISLSADPIVVADRYVIGQPSVDGGAASIDVVFHELAEPVGAGLPGRSFTKNDPALDRLVVYHIKEINGAWQVVDPPLPRVSLSVVVTSLHASVSALNKIAETRPLSRGQQAVRDAAAAQLSTLEHL